MHGTWRRARALVVIHVVRQLQILIGMTTSNGEISSSFRQTVKKGAVKLSAGNSYFDTHYVSCSLSRRSLISV